MKHLFLSLLLALPAGAAFAQAEGGISADMLKQMRTEAQKKQNPALSNAVQLIDLNKLAIKANNPLDHDTYFSHRVPTRGITDQQNSGRCWLFTGMNVMRSKMIQKYKLGAFQFSQAYNFFFDQLEKSNLFLQGVVDYAGKPMNDPMVEWLFKHPLSDGGTFCGVQDGVMKYGLVPAEVMPESFNANNTSRMASVLTLKLREYGLELRKMVADGKKAKDIEKRKTEMLTTVYGILSTCLGEPPTEFTWTRRAADGTPIETKTYTPKSFYEEYVGDDLKNNYVLLMNDPSRPYHKTYTIDFDRHSYDGADWTYLNLPMDEIKAMAIASIKDSTMMYYSCDVGKFLNTKSGVLDPSNYNYGAVFGIDFPMTKAERISTFASASSHAMTLVAVDIDENGKPKKWMVENSWGPSSGYQGHLIMTDKWFDEYSFRLVVEKKYVPAATLELLKQEPTKLPAWDPLFSVEE